MEKKQKISALKLAFSRVGIHSWRQPERRVAWMVAMDIRYEDGRQNRAPLISYPMVTTAEKKKIDVSATSSGFVVATPGAEQCYHFYNAAGEPIGQVPAAEVGKLVQIDDNAVVFRQGYHVKFYDLDAKLIGERDLTAKEIAALGTDE